MMTITLKDIPKPLHTALKTRARQHGRSLNKEALACLTSAVAPVEVNVQALLVELRQHRAAIPGQLDDSLLDQARHSGRP
jgi:plasmid stability protein